MKIQYAMGLSISMAIGMGIGGLAVQSLHAQARPPVYYVVEVDTSNLDAYMKDYAPIALKLVKDSGGRIVATGTPQSVEGGPPKTRVTVIAWDDAEKIQTWRGSAAYKASREIGDKLAKFRSYFVNGVSQ